jgi:hypothetical protein
VLSLVVLGLVLMNLKIVRPLEGFKPMVTRIDEIGRNQAVAYENLVYKPAYKETKYMSATALILVLFGPMSRLDSLPATKKALFLHCGASMAIFSGILGPNLFAPALAINRKVMLQDTGRKLSHFDDQMQAESPEVLRPFLVERR